MAKNKKFTFQKEPRETGLMSVGHPFQGVNIKLDKKVVGFIHPPCWSTKHKKLVVRFMLVGGDGNPNCDWHWMELARRDSEAEARQWCQDNVEKLVSKGLHKKEA